MLQTFPTPPPCRKHPWHIDPLSPLLLEELHTPADVEIPLDENDPPDQIFDDKKSRTPSPNSVIPYPSSLPRPPSLVKDPLPDLRPRRNIPKRKYALRVPPIP